MTITTAERIAATAAAKPYAMRQQALAWANAKRRDRSVPSDLRARASAVAATLQADMAERDRAAAAAFASR